MKKLFVLYYITSLIIILFSISYSQAENNSFIDEFNTPILADTTPTPSDSPTPTEPTPSPTTTPTPTPSANISLTSPSINWGSVSPSTQSTSGGNITVQSNVPWNLTVTGIDFTSDTGFKIPIYRLSVIIHHNGVNYSAVLSNNTAVNLLRYQDPIDTTASGGESLTYRLAIHSTDRAGTYSTSLTYTISAVQ